ncbi:MAG: hypothetical protein ABI675_29270 [Chitinophagaceae bacterium]
MNPGLSIFSSIILCLSCKEPGKHKVSTSAPLAKDTTIEYYSNAIEEKERASVEKSYTTFGKLIAIIMFQVKDGNKEDFDDGIRPWIDINQPEKDLPNLIDSKEIVISEDTVTIIIDYPLTNEFRFDLSSTNGFTREELVNEICKNYFKLYEEEERTATIKTVSLEKRKKIYNRNETNGKYGIWGHDISDLALSEIVVYKTSDGKITLTLNMES